MVSRGSKIEVICKCGCGANFIARTSDIKRGWGKFASKSCKAKHQEKRTGQYANHLIKSSNMNTNIENSFHPHDPYSLGQE